MSNSGAVEVLPTSRPVRRPPAVESEVMAMLILVVSEAMFFAGLVSAYSIISSRAPGGVWPPAGDPVLPVVETGISTIPLLLSGAAVFWSGRVFAKDRKAAMSPMLVAGVLASLFVGAQVYEATQLLAEGLTLQSSAHGGFVYTIVGAHALHTVVALGILAWSILRLRRDTLSPALFSAIRIFWYFVVGLWPFLYARVYL